LSDHPFDQNHCPTDAEMELLKAWDVAQLIVSALVDDFVVARSQPRRSGARIAARVPDFDLTITVEAKWRD
jgi:hypothetical protein